jgi:superoxide reductase
MEIIMKTLFYRCKGCGNFVLFVDEKTGCTPKCCGEPMEELVANTADAAVEKHVPQVADDGNIVKVQVGSTIHPMLDAHYIQFICLETDKGIQIKYLKPGEEPKAEFAPAGWEKAIAVYEFCNLHGLWKKDLL